MYPAGHIVAQRGEAGAEYWPSPQFWHVVAPSALYCPAAHWLQLSSDIAAAIALAVPAEQGVQTMLFAGAQNPAVHLLHPDGAPCVGAWPAAH